MASFVWQGISLSGKQVSGVQEADSKSDVLRVLRKKKIRITFVKEKAAASGLFSQKKRIKVKDLGLFTRQFATMISAGLPLIQCLEVLGHQMDHPELQSVVKLNPENKRAYKDLSRIYLEQGDYKNEIPKHGHLNLLHYQ